MIDVLSPSVYIPTTFLTIVILFAFFLTKEARKNIKKSSKHLPYFDEISLSMGYINRNILENGRLKYRKNIDSEIKYDDTIYNSLRHAGVLYSMYMNEKYGYNEEYKENRIKSSKYFVERYIKQLDENKYVVVSFPEEEQINKIIAKSGASGVALCALSNLTKENIIDINIIKGLGEFLLSMIDEDGNVYAYYDMENNKVDKEAEAIYYPGEVASGLLYLYEIDKQDKWLDTAKKILNNIIDSRKSLELAIPFDSWSLLAIEKLFLNDWVTNEEKAKYYAYGELQAVSVLTNQITNKNNSYFGAFKENIRPGSIGTIMEGLASIYTFTNSLNLKKLIYKSLSIGCLFLNRVQVKTGQQAGGLPNSANWVRAGVSQNASVIRMDNVQHVVLGWLKFQNIIRIQDYTE